MKWHTRLLTLFTLALPAAANAQDRTGTLIAYLDALQCDQITSGTFGIRAGRDDIVLRAHVVVGYRNNATGANTYHGFARNIVVKRFDRGDRIEPLSKIPIFALTDGAPVSTTPLDIFRAGHTIRFVRVLFSMNEIDDGGGAINFFAGYESTRRPGTIPLDWAAHEGDLSLPPTSPTAGAGFLHRRFAKLGSYHEFLGGNEYLLGGELLRRWGAPGGNRLGSVARWLNGPSPLVGTRTTFNLDFRGHGGRYTGTWRMVYAERCVVEPNLIVSSR